MIASNPKRGERAGRQRSRPGDTGARPDRAPAQLAEGATGTRGGWSFCIITDGRRPRKLQREVRSIRRLGFAQYEILVAGVPPAGLEGVTRIPMPGAATAGRLGEMRMALASAARFDRLVVCDDDVIFRRDFCRGLARHGGDFDVLAVRVLNPDGSRYWDRCTKGGARGHRLLDYEEAADDHVYVSGAITVLRREVALDVGWDAGLGFYEAEDVDFSRRLVAAGYRISFCREASVLHDDVRYRQLGVVVERSVGFRGFQGRIWSWMLRPLTLAFGGLPRQRRPIRPRDD